MSIFMRILGICISLHITFFSFSCSDSTDPVNTPIADNIENIKLCNVTITKMNLNTDKYRDGSAIRHASTNQEWIDANNKKEGAWCYYSGSTQYGAQYGKLYNWYAINNSRGLAPNGWRIPTDKEFDEIWECPDFSNEFGSLLGGGRYPDGTFFNLNQIGAWWTSSEVSDSQAKAKGLMGGMGIRLNYTEMKERGFSVICIKN